VEPRLSRAARRHAGRNALALAGRVGRGYRLGLSGSVTALLAVGGVIASSNSTSLARSRSRPASFPMPAPLPPPRSSPQGGRRKGGLAPSRLVSLGLARADLFLFAKRRGAGAGLLLSPPLEGRPKTPWRFRGGASFGAAEAFLMAGAGMLVADGGLPVGLCPRPENAIAAFSTRPPGVG